MKITAIVAVIVVVIAGAAVALTTMNNDGNDDGPVTVTDYLGREVTVESSARIISVTATATSILCGLGLSSNIVAVSSDSTSYIEDPDIIGMTDDDFPNAIINGMKNGTITALGGMYHMSAETIASVEADLVICDNFGTNQDIRDALDALDITYIVVSSPYSIDEIYDNIETIGKATGTESAANTMISEMKDSIQKICDWCASTVEKYMGDERYNVALMMTAAYAIGPNYLGGDILSGLCVNNVFENVGTYAAVTDESIAEADPGAIIYQNLGMGDGVTNPESYIESIYEDEVLSGTSAAKNGLIFATVEGAKCASSLGDQGIVRAYAMYAMFIYKDYLTFDIPDVLDSSNYTEYISMFWEMINS